MRFKWNDPDLEIYGIGLSVLLTLSVSLQILIVVAAIFSFIPIKLDASLDAVLPQVLALFRPEREMAFYEFFIVLAAGVQIAVIALFKNRLREAAFLKSLGAFLAVEYAWIGLLLFAAFKILAYKEPLWAKALFFTLLGLSVLSKVFWIEFRVFLRTASRWLEALPGLTVAQRVIDAGMIAAIILCLWIFDPQIALGRILAVDRWYHLDMNVMSPAFASLQGAVLNVDVFSPLGAIFPVVLGKIARWTGGFSYAHVLQVMMAFAVIYCAGFYFFLRRTLGSLALAVFGIFLFIKLHFFHISVAPLIWAFPEATVLRSLFDLPVLYLLWRHSRTGRRSYLAAAAVIGGAAIAYMPDTGFYLTLAFYIYLAAAVIFCPADKRLVEVPRDLRLLILLGLLSWVSAFLGLWIVQPSAAWSPEFWKNSTEFMNYFWQGLGNSPIYAGLRGRQFFALVAGLAIPVVYVLALFAVGFGIRCRQITAQNLWLTAVCAYGLACHWSYITRSEPTMYYAHAVPLVILLMFGIQTVLTFLSPQRRRIVHVALIVLAAGALLTNTLFLSYPNAFHPLTGKGQQERDLLSSQTDVEADRALIDKVLKPNEPAPIIASYATRMLMDTGHPVFFYYSPLIISSLVDTNEFRGTTLLTRQRMDRTIEELNSRRPQAIFIEKKLYELSVPKDYEYLAQSWLMLKNALVKNYDVVAQGKYLLHLKRKPAP